MSLLPNSSRNRAAQTAAACSRLNNYIPRKQVQLEDNSWNIHCEEYLGFSSQGLGNQCWRRLENINIASVAFVEGKDFTAPWPADHVWVVETALGDIQNLLMLHLFHAHVIDAHIDHNSVALFY